MTITSLKEAQDRFFELAERARGGEEILIQDPGGAAISVKRQSEPDAKRAPARADRPTVKPSADDAPGQPVRGLRTGHMIGEITIADDFDELPEEIMAAFRGERP